MMQSYKQKVVAHEGEAALSAHGLRFKSGRLLLAECGAWLKAVPFSISYVFDVKEILQKDYDKFAFHVTPHNKAYNDFCKENDLQPQYDRIKVADFSRKQSV